MKLYRKILSSLVVGTACAMAATSSYAGQDFKFGLELRIDLASTSTDDEDAKDNETDSDLRFQAARARANFKGSIDEKTSYRARIRFDKSMSASDNSPRDNTGDGVNLLFISHKLSDNLKLTVGKMKAKAGHVEGAMYNPMDRYHTTDYSKIMTRFEMGAMLSYMTGAQKFHFQLQNNSIETGTQDTPAMHLNWVGSFMKGMIQPVVSYSKSAVSSSISTETESGADGTVVTSTTSNDGYDETSMGFGARLNVPVGDNKVVFDLSIGNYTKGEQESESAGITSTQPERTISSTAIAARYEMKKLHLVLNHGMDDHEIDSDDTDVSDTTGTAVGLEFYPKDGSKKLRYHAMIINKTWTAANDDDKDVTESQFNLGTSLRF